MTPAFIISLVLIDIPVPPLSDIVPLAATLIPLPMITPPISLLLQL